MLFGVADTKSDKYKTRVNYKKTPEYQIYENMVARCYYPKTARYECYGGIGVKVCKEWLKFHNFAEWCEDNYVDGFFLDKDILSDDGMEYSPYNCYFVPREINNMFVLNKKKLDTDLPAGVFRRGERFVGRTQKTFRTFDTALEAYTYVNTVKHKECLKYLDLYGKKMDSFLVEHLEDYDSFCDIIDSINLKRYKKYYRDPWAECYGEWFYDFFGQDVTRSSIIGGIND